MSVRCKGRTRAKSYIPSKPDKFAIRFYASCDLDTAYVFNFFDNGRGNRSTLKPGARFCKLFPEVRTIYNQHIDNKCPPATALWVCQLLLMTKRFRLPEGKKRLIVLDSYYTSHVLGSTLSKVTDNTTKILGTVKLSMIDKHNKTLLTEAINLLKNAERGKWYLVPSFNYDGTKQIQAENAGFVVWVDKKIVRFYCNDLDGTPPPIISDETSETAIKCVRGLLSIERWTGKEIMNRTIFKTPAIIVAYNAFMNAVDRSDQKRSTNPTCRREKRAVMSLFTWILDIAVNNAVCIT